MAMLIILAVGSITAMTIVVVNQSQHVSVSGDKLVSSSNGAALQCASSDYSLPQSSSVLTSRQSGSGVITDLPSYAIPTITRINPCGVFDCSVMFQKLVAINMTYYKSQSCEQSLNQLYMFQSTGYTEAKVTIGNVNRVYKISGVSQPTVDIPYTMLYGVPIVPVFQQEEFVVMIPTACSTHADNTLISCPIFDTAIQKNDKTFGITTYHQMSTEGLLDHRHRLLATTTNMSGKVFYPTVSCEDAKMVFNTIHQHAPHPSTLSLPHGYDVTAGIIDNAVSINTADKKSTSVSILHPFEKVQYGRMECDASPHSSSCSSCELQYNDELHPHHLSHMTTESLDSSCAASIGVSIGLVICCAAGFIFPPTAVLSCTGCFSLGGVALAVEIIHCLSAPPRPSCFPEDAVVWTSPTSTLAMKDVKIGTVVAAYNNAGEIVYEPVYFNGHEDDEATRDHFKITIYNNQTQDVKYVEMTSDHFAPVLLNIEGSQTVMTKAKNIKKGDLMMAADQVTMKMSVYQVDDVSMSFKRGLYNPYTLSGNIIVNSVAVSCHSDWIFDKFFEYFGSSEMIPSVYQGMLSPLRGLYSLFGGSHYHLVTAFASMIVWAPFSTESTSKPV